MLTNTKGLAKVSSTPGKTRLINHFTIDNRWYLVDLPGYGYARVSKSVRGKFSALITDYVIKHPGLHMLFVLVDIRHEPQKIDVEFINFLGEEGVPFGIIFTKADKLSPGAAKKNHQLYCDHLLESWEELPPTFITSSSSGVGKEDVLNFIGEALSEADL